MGNLKVFILFSLLVLCPIVQGSIGDYFSSFHLPHESHNDKNESKNQDKAHEHSPIDLLNKSDNKEHPHLHTGPISNPTQEEMKLVHEKIARDIAQQQQKLNSQQPITGQNYYTQQPITGQNLNNQLPITAAHQPHLKHGTHQSQPMHWQTINSQQPINSQDSAQQPITGQNVNSQQPISAQGLNSQQQSQQPISAQGSNSQQPISAQGSNSQQPISAQGSNSQQPISAQNVYSQQPISAQNVYSQQPMSAQGVKYAPIPLSQLLNITQPNLKVARSTDANSASAASSTSSTSSTSSSTDQLIASLANMYGITPPSAPIGANPPVGAVPPPIPPIGGLPLGLGSGLNFGIDTSAYGGLVAYYPIIEKIIVVVGGGILILIFCVLIQGSLLKGGFLNNFGSSFSKAVSGSWDADIGPFHASNAGAAAFAFDDRKGDVSNRVSNGINRRF